jgi:hypothetical protein
MANYVSLDEAAKLLGVTAAELIEMRSRGEIFGFRDGASWKFKADEIERVKLELSGDVLSDDPGGSSILVSERPGGSSASGLGLAAEQAAADAGSSDLHLDLGMEGADAGSDVALVADPSSGSGLRLVHRSGGAAPAEDDDDELKLASDDEELEVDASSLSHGSGLELAADLGSDLRLADDASSTSRPPQPASSQGAADSDLLGDAELQLQPVAAGGSPGLDLDLGDELKLSGDADDDLVLGGGSDLALGADSGINLMAPSDSGLSLEDESPELEGVGISGLDLGSAVGSDVDLAGASPSGSGSGGSGAGLSGIDFGPAEDFQLGASGGIEVDDDSGSQVIEIEDSTDLGGVPLQEGLGIEGGFDVGGGEGMLETAPGLAGTAVARGLPEIPLANWEVFLLLSILLVLGLSGLLVTDIVRNMWAWNGESDGSITSWFTQMIMSSVNMQR